MTLQYEENNN